MFCCLLNHIKTFSLSISLGFLFELFLEIKTQETVVEQEKSIKIIINCQIDIYFTFLFKSIKNCTRNIIEKRNIYYR